MTLKSTSSAVAFVVAFAPTLMTHPGVEATTGRVANFPQMSLYSRVEPCWVKDLSSSVVYQGTGKALKLAIKAASPGATLRIKGQCAAAKQNGMVFVIDKDLSLQGRTSESYGTPTISSTEGGTVLTVVAGRVALTSIKVTGGGSSGVVNNGILKLKGSSSVYGNRASSGGGIQNNAGATLTLDDKSTVASNHSTQFGGGITNDGALTLRGAASVSSNSGIVGGGIVNRGTLTILGSSSVKQNGSYAPGGGIYNVGVAVIAETSIVSENMSQGGAGVYNYGGTLFMAGDSLISANVAQGGPGGGLYNDGGSVTLEDGASVTGNSSNEAGGGIYNGGALYACDGGGNDTWIGSISPNAPDDPPSVTYITC